jgi:hypothetical protein
MAAGFISEWWTASNRNGGRLHVGKPGRNKSESQAEANEAARTSAKTQLEADWGRFETEVQKYVESFGAQINQQRATFKLQAEAQLKAWREAAHKFQAAARGFAAEPRSEIDATVTRMKADAAAADDCAMAGVDTPKIPNGRPGSDVKNPDAGNGIFGCRDARLKSG